MCWNNWRPLPVICVVKAFLRKLIKKNTKSILDFLELLYVTLWMLYEQKNLERSFQTI